MEIRLSIRNNVICVRVLCTNTLSYSHCALIVRCRCEFSNNCFEHAWTTENNTYWKLVIPTHNGNNNEQCVRNNAAVSYIMLLSPTTQYCIYLIDDVGGLHAQHRTIAHKLFENTNFMVLNMNRAHRVLRYPLAYCCAIESKKTSLHKTGLFS